MASDLKTPMVHNGVLSEGERLLFATESSLLGFSVGARSLGNTLHSELSQLSSAPLLSPLSSLLSSVTHFLAAKCQRRLESRGGKEREGG